MIATLSESTLQDTLDALGRFSAAGPGVTRLAYDRHWCDAHRWLAQQANALGLETTCDAAGNLFFHAAGARADQPVLLVGSHLDSVRNGGLYDGAYGAVCGLFAAAELKGRAGIPVVGIVTAEEEGSRFSGDMLGARALLGRVDPGELDDLRDAGGANWREALAFACERDCATPVARGSGPAAGCFRAAAMIEMHIEQGPVLEQEGHSIGLVENIIGYRRLRVTLTGESRHAGTTPMRMRRDALAGAAEVILAVEVAAREMGDPAVATAGNVMPEPGLYNVVPGRAELHVEMRHVDGAKVEALARSVQDACAAVARRRGLTADVERVAGLDPVRLHAPLVDAAERLAHETGVSHRRMASGAGHDAMLFAAAGIPTLLMFVPSRNGISHSPEEFTDPAALWTGYTLLRDFLRSLEQIPA